MTKQKILTIKAATQGAPPVAINKRPNDFEWKIKYEDVAKHVTDNNLFNTNICKMYLGINVNSNNMNFDLAADVLTKYFRDLLLVKKAATGEDINPEDYEFIVRSKDPFTPRKTNTFCYKLFNNKLNKVVAYSIAHEVKYMLTTTTKFAGGEYKAAYNNPEHIIVWLAHDSMYLDSPSQSAEFTNYKTAKEVLEDKKNVVVHISSKK